MAGEHVILLDEQDQPAGMLEKYAAHTFDTPLHLAFSCWLFNQQGQLLVTRRSLGKSLARGMDQLGLRTPQQGETFEQAVTRRCRFELGVEISISRRFTRPSATGRSPQTVSLRTKCARYMPRAW
ncbi:NUDIX domain-containing protein [Klebsiella pneumoniae]|nr:NUDIX domain-containing protein [Klebsiella pneumoniae]